MQLTQINDTKIQSLKNVESTTYNNFINQYNSFLKENNRKIDLLSIQDYIKQAQEFYAIKSMEILKSALKRGIEETYINTPYFLQFSYIIDKAFSKINVGKKDSKIHSEKLITDSEIDILLSGAKIFDTKKNEENEILPDKDVFLMVQFLKETGLRISELLTLENEMFSQNNRVYYFTFIGKGKKERTNFILDDIFNETKKHYQGNIYLFEFEKRKIKYSIPEKEKIRKWISHKLNKYSKMVIGREINPHDFRHYFATRMLKEGKTIKAIANWLGHSTTSITNDMYVHDGLTPDDIY
ncbi:MAG: site-specific integrase [Leptospiraceae bacterium]|nr:site-specific integrase [Leptospiraceae bacterium]